MLRRAFAQRAHVPLDTARKLHLTAANGQRPGLLTQAASINVGRARGIVSPLTVDDRDGSLLSEGIDSLLRQSFRSRIQTEFTRTRWSIGRAD
jgi:aspartyl protease family protein